MITDRLISQSLMDAILDITEETSKTSLNKRQLNHIAKLTDENSHTMAIGHAARYLGRDDIHKNCLQIRKEHIKAGGLTQDLRVRREAEWEKLDSHAKQNLSPEDYKKLYDCF